MISYSKGHALQLLYMCMTSNKPATQQPANTL